MPYAQIAAAPTTRPMPPITAVQRPACPTMAAGMAAEVPLITFGVNHWFVMIFKWMK